MKKLSASVVKELLLLINDRAGLLLMFLMPTLLVFIVTIIQDSAFQIVKDNKIDILVVNQDRGALGDSLISIIQRSGSFSIEFDDQLNVRDLKSHILDRNKLAGLSIPAGFSDDITGNARRVSSVMLSEFGISDSSAVADSIVRRAEISLFFDPILQENYRAALVNSLQTMVRGIESSQMLTELYRNLGYEELPPGVSAEMRNMQTSVKAELASIGESKVIPNTSQHNVPAWSIFAMFFMVISLGGNLVKERISGSFVRLQTVPFAFLLTIISKVIVYVCVGLTQLTILFLIGIYLFPLIGLPVLAIPGNPLPLFVISVLSVFAAVSYAIVVGTYSRTQEQANGFGAVSIIIFAAIGGIWIPSFVMPEYILSLAKVSPLYWCLEGYYTVFLRNGSWEHLAGTVVYLVIFIFATFGLTLLRLRKQNYL